MEDYRPLTLLNADYKLLTRILVHRLYPWLADFLHHSQHCGVPSHTIFYATAVICDTIAHAEYTHSPLCMVSLDFQAAFYNSHTCLFAILESYVFSGMFQERIRAMHTDVTSSVKINGHVSSPNPTSCSIRQGCPLSMLLFALCLDPLLHVLANALTVIRVGRSNITNALQTYADFVTSLLNSLLDILKIKEAIDLCGAASGARINIQK
jgi:hypothetical protein